MLRIGDALWRLRYRVDPSHFLVGIETLRRALPPNPVFVPAQTVRDQQLFYTAGRVIAYGKSVEKSKWVITPAQKQWRRMWLCVQGLQKRYQQLSDAQYAEFQNMYGPIFQSTTPTPSTDGKGKQYGSA